MTENGQVRGRAVPVLHQHTIADTGIAVNIRKISPMLRDDVEQAVRKKFPPPAVPITETELGKEENPADPDHQKALAAWTAEHIGRVGDELLRLAIQRGIEVEIDHGAVAALRDDMAALGVDLDPDDKYVYVTRICVGSQDDLKELSAAIFARSMPTREAVEGHKATFRDNVQGD